MNSPLPNVQAHKHPVVLRRVLLVLLIVALLALAAVIARNKGYLSFPYGAAFDTWHVKLTPVGGAFDTPVGLTGAGDGSNRLFVIEKAGRIRIIADGQTLPTPFLDISSIVNSQANERGLLGLAFDPHYADNGRFYVHYSDARGDTTIARYQVSAGDPNRADPASGQIILTQQQPYPNHNGGQLAFSPKDGYLYIGLGDGGSGGDPQGNGQNKAALLGKILRLDVSDADTYTIPPDNPVSRDPSFAPEVWDYGLRNPWRFSFDAETGDLWIADVGQNQWEEINFEPADSPGGVNYGWNIEEGSHPYGSAQAPAGVSLTRPIFEYSHQQGISVTGGYVYRGSAIPALTGVYLFADYGYGTIWATQRDGDGWKTDVFMSGVRYAISSFGQDDQRELYVVDMGGAVYRLDPA